MVNKIKQLVNVMNGMLYSMTETDLESSIFIVKLSNDQKVYLNSVLPNGYAFQLHQPTITALKNLHPRKINFAHKEEPALGREDKNNKRRRSRLYQDPPL
jgi:hypothetical protein